MNPEDVAAILGAGTIRDYVEQPYPSPRDRAIGDLVRAYSESESSVRARLAESLTDGLAHTLTIYCLRAQKHAASREELLLAAVALAFAGPKVNELSRILAPNALARRAVELGIEPDQFLREAAAYGDDSDGGLIGRYRAMVEKQRVDAEVAWQELHRQSDRVLPAERRGLADLGPLKIDDGRIRPTVPIPSSRDGHIADIVQRFIEAGADARIEFADYVKSQPICWGLLSFSDRMASLGVRTGLAETVLRSAVALGMVLEAVETGGMGMDPRDAWLHYPVAYDAAVKIGADADGLYRQAASLVGDKGAESLRSFLRRTDKSLRSMGYVEGTDEDGFIYSQSW